MKQRIISKNELRARRLIDTPLRVIYSPDFDKRYKKKEIIAEMPDFEKFNSLRKKVVQLRASENVAPEMRPCYEEPLLTKQQEFHLFRKMNYFKYHAKRLIASMNPRRVSETKLDRIDWLLSEANKIRNQIANSNFRLATQLLKKQSSFYREHSLTEGSLSDGYFDVLKAIDYFDFNTGYKFSTYCTWVLKKNFSRDMKNQTRYQEKFVTGVEENFADIQEDNFGDVAEATYNNNKKMVARLLDVLAKSDCGGDVQRQVYAIQEWFGLNGKDRRTLEAISRDMKITKERVRQLKEKGLELIRSKVNELGLVYEGVAE